MNLSQLINEVNKDIDDSMPDQDIIGWLNRGLDDITPIARVEGKKVTDVSPLNAYELPEDLYEMVHLTVDDQTYESVSLRDKTMRGYKIWGNVLSLNPAAESGLIELYYYKQLNHLVNSEDVPGIPSQFHDLLVLYAVAHTQFADEEPERQRDAMMRYNQRKLEYEAYVLGKQDIGFQIIDVHGW